MNPKREGLAGAADGDLEPEVVPVTRASHDEVFRREPGPEGRLLQLAGRCLRGERVKDHPANENDALDHGQAASWVSIREASTLSMRRPSRSTTSKRHPSVSTASPAFGRCWSSPITRPATVS